MVHSLLDVNGGAARIDVVYTAQTSGNGIRHGHNARALARFYRVC